MTGMDQRYVARLRDDGGSWCIVDRRTGGYAIPSKLRLDNLPEEVALLLALKLNQAMACRQGDA